MAASPFNSEVTALLDENKHPLRAEIDLLRTIILSADKSIEEGVKWNAASFRTTDWFATLNGPRHAKEPMIILHAGARAKGIVMKDRIPDPEGLIRWLGIDRGQIIFKDMKNVKAKQQALQAILSAWIKLI